MQYRKGLVTVTNGSNIVTGDANTKWLTQFTGDTIQGVLFAIPNQVGIYTCQQVNVDGTITLTSPWEGDDLTANTYWLTVDFTPINGLPMPQPFDLDVTKVVSDALTIIDQKIGLAPQGIYSVASITTTTPPASPSEGDAYIVPAGATGLWTGYANKLAVYRRSAWNFCPVPTGVTLQVADQNIYYRWNGTAWTQAGSLTQTVSTDGTLAGDSDANLPTQKAVKTYVDAASAALNTTITNLIAGAPGALDTLNELASALGDDANFATTTATALNNRLRIDTNQGLNPTQQAQGRANLNLGTVSTLNIDTDATFVADSDSIIPTQKAVATAFSTRDAASITSLAGKLDKAGGHIGAATGGDMGAGSINAQALYVNGQPIGVAANFLFLENSYTATAGQTAYATTYTPGYLQVFQNGVKLAPADYTATNGTSITLLTTVSAGDAIDIIGFQTVSLSTPVYSNPVSFQDGGLWNGSGISGLTKLGLNMTPVNVCDITQNQNAGSRVNVLNSNVGTGAYASLRAQNGTNSAELGQLGQNYATNGCLVTGYGYVQSTTGLSLITGGTNPILFGINNVEKMRIAGNGNLLIGGTYDSGHGVTINESTFFNGSVGGGDFSGASYTADPAGFGYFTSLGFGLTGAFYNGGITTNNGNGFSVIVNSGGMIMGYNATNWASLSERAKKKNFKPIVDALTIVSNINAELGNYQYEDDGAKLRPFVFFEDAEIHWPHATTVREANTLTMKHPETGADITEDVPEFKGVSYELYVPLLIKAFHEQIEINKTLSARLDALEGKK